MRHRNAAWCAAAAFAPAAASAHVKWFCATADVSAPPVAPADVASPVFVACCAAFLVLVFAGTAADGVLARLWPGAVSSGGRLRRLEEGVVRAGVGLYCLALADRAAVVPWGHAGAILTPELLDHDWAVGAVQVGVAAAVLWRRTCGLAGVGLLALLGVGVARYGVFHMTDYLYFVGLAAYLVLTSVRDPAWRRWRLPALAGSLGFALMWTAVEKFLYPQWTAAILVTHPDLTFGLPGGVVIVIAGFVEFSLAFYLVVGQALLRVAAAALMAVFVSAVPEFGTLDSVGHLPIVAILLAVCLRGGTPLQGALRLAGRGPVVNAAAVCGLYVATLGVMAGMYYGLQLTAARG